MHFCLHSWSIRRLICLCLCVAMCVQLWPCFGQSYLTHTQPLCVFVSSNCTLILMPVLLPPVFVLCWPDAAHEPARHPVMRRLFDVCLPVDDWLSPNVTTSLQWLYIVFPLFHSCCLHPCAFDTNFYLFSEALASYTMRQDKHFEAS